MVNLGCPQWRLKPSASFPVLVLMLKTSCGSAWLQIGRTCCGRRIPRLLHILPVDDKAALVGEWHPLGLGLETDAVPPWLQLTL